MKVVEATLSRAGHKIVTATDGHSALEKLKNEQFQLVITDANMPGITGFQLTSTIRQQKECKNIAIMLLTGRRDKKDVLKALDSGADDYLMKPVDPILLLAKVESLLVKHTGHHSFYEAAITAQGSWENIFEIVSVSEQGMTFLSPFTLEFNEKIRIVTDLFNQIGNATPTLRVSTCSALETSKQLFRVRASFVGLSSAELQNIRVWLMANHGKAKKIS